MKVSLLILAYNEESYIEEVVNKYKNYFESLIIVNDFSTDKTGSILDDLTIKNDNIFYV